MLPLLIDIICHPRWFSIGYLVGSPVNRLLSPRLKTWRIPLLSLTPTPPWTMWPRCWSPLTEGWEAWKVRPAAPCLEADCMDQEWERSAASRWARTHNVKKNRYLISQLTLYKIRAEISKSSRSHHWIIVCDSPKYPQTHPHSRIRMVTLQRTWCGKCKKDFCVLCILWLLGMLVVVCSLVHCKNCVTGAATYSLVTLLF